LRILPPGSSYSGEPSLGRVVTHQNQRGTGIGHALLKRANQTLDELWPLLACRISAQSHLTAYYNQHEFIEFGKEYLEDGIPHVAMRRPPAKQK
jgi:ElaA protein